MITQDSLPERGFLLLGGDDQREPDLRHVFDSVGMAYEAGHLVVVDSVYYNGLEEPVPLEVGSGDNRLQMGFIMPLQRSRNALSRTIFDRWQSTPDDMLTARETSLRDLLSESVSQIEDPGRREVLLCTNIRNAIGAVGGVVLLGSDTHEGIAYATELYDTFRQVGVGEGDTPE
jgi:hypothetical protein